jgi:TetR/AcrR family transcriptional repressor of nem operon
MPERRHSRERVVDRKTQKEQTRRNLVTLAAEVVREQGPERVSVEKLMRRLGLTHGGFYAHFRSKDDLLIHAIDEMFEQAEAELRRVTANAPPQEALRCYIDYYLTAHHAAVPGTGCPLAAVGADVTRLGEGARARYRAGVERLTQALTEHFQRLGLEEKMAAEEASALLAALAGTILLARPATPSHRESLLEQARSIFYRRLAMPRSFIHTDAKAAPAVRHAR